MTSLSRINSGENAIMWLYMYSYLVFTLRLELFYLLMMMKIPLFLGLCAWSIPCFGSLIAFMDMLLGQLFYRSYVAFNVVHALPNLLPSGVLAFLNFNLRITLFPCATSLKGFWTNSPQLYLIKSYALNTWIVSTLSLSTILVLSSKLLMKSWISTVCIDV